MMDQVICWSLKNKIVTPVLEMVDAFFSPRELTESPLMNQDILAAGLEAPEIQVKFTFSPLYSRVLLRAIPSM